MRKDFGTKTWLYPMPVFIVAAYDEERLPNAMVAAWGGIYTDDMIGLCLAEEHKTTRNIRANGAFTVSVGTAHCVEACDFLGIVSGDKVPDKLAQAGLSTVRASHVNAPIIENLPFTLECEMVNYDIESNFLVGRIINVSADEAVLTNGQVDVRKLRPITYDPISRKYIELGAIVGNAFSDGKKYK